MTAILDAAPAHLSTRQRVVLLVLLGAQFMLAVDFSILNVALPAIGAGLHFDLDDLQWVATAFALPAAGFTLLFGRIGDLFGRRRLFLAGLVLLVGASLLGGFAQYQATLLTARVLQGFAAAMATPAALSLLTTSFPEGPLRDRALGLNGALLSSGFTTGALLGGVLADVLGWRWAFLLNVPVALIVLAVTPFVVASGRALQRPRLDVPGAITVTLGLLLLVFGLTQGSILAVAGSVVLLAAFWQIERRAAEPLAPLRILRRPTVRWGNLGGLLAFAMGSAVVFLSTIYLQEVLGYSALTTGLALAVPGIAAVAGGVLGGRLIGRFGRRTTLAGGLAVQGLAFLGLVALGSDRAMYVPLVLLLSVGFFGHIAAIVAYTVTATSGLPDGEQGLATGLSTLTQQVALTVGIPLVSAVAATSAGVLSGVHTAVVVDAGLTLAGAFAIYRGLRERRP
ncbi:MFS transporter [Dactylosporangium matsuzakiense]|uniref:MFS transporter n=1 Tax=Dactylosporangium matsuzakiense TaxID=53360 RepID=A0A9W6KG39_9ACTN|nr:MFS transporter [Dactylosporangium matsuzakiense]UWZ48210.1 MFS transporter [Dactylosporangium matsuzakiense]GLL01442.1 MFS transporter [Dactylosporangium matsuzakiense]